MNFKEISTFIEVARSRNLTKAAKNLYMTPQGVSRIIKSIEEECGEELFSRKAHGMELTECGKCFLEHAHQMESQYLAMRDEIRKIGKKRQIQVDLLSAYGIIRYLHPDCLQEFMLKYPEVEFRCWEYPDREVERRFVQEEGNIALCVGVFDEQKYRVTQLQRFPIRLLVHKNHPLSGRKRVSLKELMEEDWYLESSEFYISHLMKEACRAAGFELKPVFETSGFSLCHKMVAQNKGISVTLDFILEDMQEKDVIKIELEENLEWSVCILERNDCESSPAIQNFITHLKQWQGMLSDGKVTR